MKRGLKVPQQTINEKIDGVTDPRAQIAIMEASDTEARSENKLVGRVVRSQVFDGYAYYEVIQASGQAATLEHIEVLDAYRDRTMEMMAMAEVGDPAFQFIVPIRYVNEMIDQWDRWTMLYKVSK